MLSHRSFEKCEIARWKFCYFDFITFWNVWNLWRQSVSKCEGWMDSVPDVSTVPVYLYILPFRVNRTWRSRSLITDCRTSWTRWSSRTPGGTGTWTRRRCADRPETCTGQPSSGTLPEYWGMYLGLAWTATCSVDFWKVLLYEKPTKFSETSMRSS